LRHQKIEGEDLEKLPSYYRIIKSYEGKGNLHLSDGRKLDCDFECGQNEAGDIIVYSSINSTNSDLIMEVWFDGLEISHMSGHTVSGQRIQANLTQCISSSLGSKNSPAFLVFNAKDLTVGELAAPLNALNAHLVNFKFILPLSCHFRGYDVIIKKTEGYAEKELEMDATNRPKMTAELTVTSPNNHIVNITEVTDILHDTCLLLSLASGCRIQWLYWDAYSADDGQTISYHWNGWSSPFSNWTIILKNPPEDIREFLRHTFDPYQDVKKEGIWQFDGAISHFVDAVSSENMLELKATNLVVLTDYLTKRFAKHKKSNLNRSFKSLLRHLQKDCLNLDVDEEELDLFIKIRNKLVHEASFLDEGDFLDVKMDPEDPLKQYHRILSLTSRIMLAILKYRGYYHDWLKSKPGEWAGSDVSGRVEMRYLEST
jgi:hypothetical protein